MKLSLIIPVFNEVDHLNDLVDAVFATSVNKEVIIVDDGSTDGSVDLIHNKILKTYPDIQFIQHEQNRGKGAAIRTGIQKATGDLLLIQDADLEYDPRDYSKLIDMFKDAKNQVVYGSRFLSGKRVTHPLHYFVNQFITIFGNVLYGAKLTDLETCYKMFRTDYIKALPLSSNGFEIEAEMTSKVLKSKVTIPEVPIYYRGRNYSQGKKITWVDGIKAIWTLLKFRFTN